jgi:hypothetical protein
MPRERKNFQRRSGLRDASLVVIACEGVVAEPDYFQGLKAELHNPRLHVEVLTRADPGHSSPQHLLRSLDAFAAEYRIRPGDTLWLVADRDPQAWPEAMLSQVATGCQQRHYQLAISNPCFELWLWLHFEDVARQGPDRQETLLRNEDRLLKRLVAAQRSGQCNDFALCAPYMEDALLRAKALDATPENRWPQQLGTHVYRLVEHLLQRSRTAL